MKPKQSLIYNFYIALMILIHYFFLFSLLAYYEALFRLAHCQAGKYQYEYPYGSLDAFHSDCHKWYY